MPKFLKSTHKNQTVLTLKGWIKYNGKFGFSVIAKDAVNGLRNVRDVEQDIYRKLPSRNYEIDFSVYNKFRYSGSIYCDSNVDERFLTDTKSWGDFNFHIYTSVWQSWAETTNIRFSAFIFSENFEMLDEVVKTIGDNVYIK